MYYRPICGKKKEQLTKDPNDVTGEMFFAGMLAILLILLLI